MAAQALNTGYTQTATSLFSALTGVVIGLRYLITNRGAGVLDVYAADAYGNQLGAAIAVAAGATMLLVSPLASGRIQIYGVGESASGNADIMPVNVPQ
jgi:hypothetical protein